MIENFSLASVLVFDVLVACGVIVGSLTFFFTAGKYSIVPAFCALGFGAVFASMSIFVDFVPVLTAFPEYQVRAALFITVCTSAFLIFRRHPYFEPTTAPSAIESGVFAIVFAGFVLAIIGSFLPSDVVVTLTPNIRIVFVAGLARTLWLISPVVAFIAMRG